MAQPDYEIQYDQFTGRPYYVPKSARTTPQQNYVTVRGRAGADRYEMGPNCKAILLDETAPVVWLKVTDGAGYPTLDGYDLSPHVEKTPEDEAKGLYADLDARLKKIENLLEVITSGRKPDLAEAGGSGGE